MQPPFFEALVDQLCAWSLDEVPEWIPCTDWDILRDLPTMAERRKWLRKAKLECTRRAIQDRVDEIAEAWKNQDELALYVLMAAFPEDLKLHNKLAPVQRRMWTDKAAMAACGQNELVAGEPVIYFISADDTVVKIGHTTNLRARLRSLRTAHPKELHILLAIPGSRDDELELHRRFAEFRVGREWYKLVEPIISYIAESGAVLAWM
jgi:hypothetical protein